MKKLVILILFATLILALAAQSAKEEAIQSLDNAKRYIQQDNLAKAQDEMNYASSKISEILSEQLVLFIPDAPTGYVLEEKNAQGLGQMGSIVGSANAIAAFGKYNALKEDPDGNTPNLTLTISVGGIMGQVSALAGLGNMFSGMGMSASNGSGTKTLRVGGYSGTQEFSASDGSGTLTVQVGSKISVIVEGDNIKSADVMKVLAEKIDLAKLEKSF